MKYLATLTILLLAFSVNASPLKVGDQLPALLIKDKGALINEANDEVSYQAFSTDSLPKKRFVFFVMPARLGDSDQVMPLIERLYEMEYPNTCRTINIVDIDQAVFGTGFIAEMELKRHKRRTPKCAIINDYDGEARDRWNLPKDLCATIVTDENGKILFYHEGELSNAQIDKVIQLSNPSN